MALNFSTTMPEDRKKWSDAFKTLKKNDFQPRILYSEKLPNTKVKSWFFFRDTRLQMFYLPVLTLRKLPACVLCHMSETLEKRCLTQERKRKGPGCQSISHPGQSRADDSRRDSSKKVKMAGEWRHLLCGDNI